MDQCALLLTDTPRVLPALQGISPTIGGRNHISPFSQVAPYRSSSHAASARQSSPGSTPMHPNAVQTSAPFGQHHHMHVQPTSAGASLLPGFPPNSQPNLPPIFMQPQQQGAGGAGLPPAGPQQAQQQVAQQQQAQQGAAQPQQPQQQVHAGQKHGNPSSGGQHPDQPPAKVAKVSPFANPLTQIDISTAGAMGNNWQGQQQGNGQVGGQSNGQADGQSNGQANGQANGPGNSQQQAQQQGQGGPGQVQATRQSSLAMLKTEDLPSIMDRGQSGALFAQFGQLPSITGELHCLLGCAQRHCMPAAESAAWVVALQLAAASPADCWLAAGLALSASLHASRAVCTAHTVHHSCQDIPVPPPPGHTNPPANAVIIPCHPSIMPRAPC
jgi:hypothetical protein